MLAKLYGTDKSGIHSYTQHYKNHFEKLKNKKLKLLEIGVGGYDNPDAGGNSLKMWKKYFKHGNIFSIDIYDKSRLQEKRIKIFKGSQIDKSFLSRVIAEMGEIDIIIDDGSHINEHVIESFKYLFPKLKDGGIYIIEDTQTSYWEEYGGDSKNFQNSLTIMNFFKSLTDALNYKEFRISNYEASYYDKNISSIHFYHNMIFIYKNYIAGVPA
jgi:demethylmacrocin O-methyltransferase